MKSDISVFVGWWLAFILGGIGMFFGFILLFGNTILGLVVMIVSFFVARYWMFKAKRRKGLIIYQGGEI